MKFMASNFKFLILTVDIDIKTILWFLFNLKSAIEMIFTSTILVFFSVFTCISNVFDTDATCKTISSKRSHWLITKEIKSKLEDVSGHLFYTWIFYFYAFEKLLPVRLMSCVNVYKQFVLGRCAISRGRYDYGLTSSKGYICIK